ncbi:hypothetical protein B0H21DRAFT_759278 [Amylocystis lapponica]|nr:hypothetical protein B0H21DRAFT_759278 [Amylocystis lapponica]
MAGPDSAATTVRLRIAHSEFCWYIPAELRDYIIDQLHADRCALKACSLTCHAWLPRARYHLFQSIALDPRRCCNDFQRLIRSAPVVATYVRHVELRGNTGSPKWWAGDTQLPHLAWPTLGHTTPPRRHGDSDVPEIVNSLERMLPCDAPPLRKVTSLCLSAIPIGAPITRALVLRFQNISVLSLDGCKALAFADFVDLLHAFSRVDTLRILAAQWLPRTSASLEVRHQSFPRLKRLEMSRKIDVAPLISWMLAQSVHSEIVSLSCSVSGEKSAFAIRNLLHAIGPTLEHLEIGFQETRDPTDVLQSTHLDLTSCTGLRRLRLSCSATHWSSYRPSLSWVVILLSKMESPQLGEIVLSIRRRDVCALNFEGVDVVLSQARFASLERLVFDIELQREFSEFCEPEEPVRKRLSALDAKGVLRFDCHGP